MPTKGGVYATLPNSARTLAPRGGEINPYLWGIGGKYLGPSMPIQAWVAYEQHHHMFGFGAISPRSAGKQYPAALVIAANTTACRGVGYTFGDIFTYVNFEQLKYQYDVDPVFGGGTVSYKRNAWSIDAKWNIATGYVGAQFIDALNASCDGNVAGLTGSPNSSCGNTSGILTTTLCPSRRRPTS